MKRQKSTLERVWEGEGAIEEGHADATRKGIASARPPGKAAASWLDHCLSNTKNCGKKKREPEKKSRRREVGLQDRVKKRDDANYARQTTPLPARRDGVGG